MADVKWIKIATDIFDDEKILLIESLPSADAIIVIWFKLLCLAGKNNNDGVFMMNDRIAYTDEMLATVFRKDVNTVRMALKTFSDFGMIEMIDGVVTIPNWSKHQQLEKIKARNEYMKLYMRDRRSAQKALICDSQKNSTDVKEVVKEVVNTPVNINNTANVNNDVKVNVNANVNNEIVNCKHGCKQPVSALDRYKQDNEDNKDTKDDKDKIPRNESIDLSDLGIVSIPAFLQSIIDEWNMLTDVGVKPIRTIDPESNKAFKIFWNIKNYGRDSFTECIANIRKSDYLQGKAENSKNPISFDWLIDETNYVKVYEGMYNNYNPFPNPKEKKGGNAFNQYSQKAKENFSELEAKLLDN